jgi:hypothetical protein
MAETKIETADIKEGDSKTVNGITVDIHDVRDAQVYFAQYRTEDWGKGWPFYRMDRADFERLWEAEK